MDLTITSSTDETNRSVLHLVGALDLATRSSLLDQARQTISDASTTALVLNMAEIDFIDSTGIGAVVELAGNASDADVDFVLQSLSPRVTRILDLTGLIDAWPVEKLPVE
ncbi:anti-sigma B factor antagonist [Jatrophihabitans sp. GAS493]|uniref:STAS domain-containing protein n=1 Tax=Jatrophihabitans sp. GAS493 TaxID=1907575 RepID=UPI000BB92231|nr:STAS domain-containing protein [Jatrophihabitans sp. GAS493]SOD73272.1 anti-sigma B factor antagonist [Jatrophihabitans sp. GAS493]